MRVTFDNEPFEPNDEGWQPALFRGLGTASILRQRPLFSGAFELKQRPPRRRDDQPSLFREVEENSCQLRQKR